VGSQGLAPARMGVVRQACGAAIYRPVHLTDTRVCPPPSGDYARMAHTSGGYTPVL